MQERRAGATLSRTRTLVLTTAVAVAVVVVDQVTTTVAIDHLRHPVHLLGPLGLGLAFNSGSAFSILAGAGLWIVPALVAVLAVVVAFAVRARRTVLALGYGLVLGGAIGNLGDRLFRGYHGDVVDFITLHHWPTFNVADAAITVGVVVLIGALLRADRHARREEAPEAGSASGEGAHAQAHRRSSRPRALR